MRTTITFIILLLFAGYLSAQDNQSSTNSDQPNYQITVTGDRLEESVSEKSDAVTVITREDIEAHQWNLVVDALREVPGLSLVQSGSPGKVTSVFLRGAGSAQVLVLLDGVPINNPYFGGVDFENLTTDNIQRIEVLKGPQSPLYGSDSIGGVIQIISKKGFQGNQFAASFDGGSFNTYREGLGIRGGQQSYDYSATFSRLDTDGQTTNDEFKENALNANSHFRISDTTKLSVLGQLFDSHIGIPFHVLFDPVTFQPYNADSPLQNQDNNLVLGATTLQQDAGRFANLKAQFSYTHRNFHFEDPGTFSPLSENHSGVYQLTFQDDAALTPSDTLSAGYEFEHQGIKASDQTGQFLDEVIQNHSIFVQNKFSNAQWIVAAGFRWDHYNTFGNTVNPRISAAYKIQEDWKVRGSFGTGFRAPSAGDLAYPFYGNPDLKPEKSKSWEAGVDHFVGRHVSISGSYFHNQYDDLITFDPITFVAGNVAKARAQGVELETNWHSGAWEITGGYAYMDTEDEITHLRLFRRPKNSGSFRLAYNQNRWGASMNFLGVGNRLETDYITSENVLNPGYATFDVAGYYRIGHSWKLKGRVDNLFDKDYEEVLYYKAPGIGFYGGIEATF
ncbi:MAG: hypothetical protein C5B54_07490 [Acidobacteria bacterium]|nr:MAG: hypothetical protein C5B54_07490 [Acidobacteriota bacterium]